MAQTFTPSIAGRLSELDLFVSQGQPSSEPVFVSIYNTQAGMPNQVLGTVDLNLTTQNWTWYDLDFNAQNVYLSSSSIYAIVISTEGLGGYANPAGSVEDHYSGGTSLVQNGTGAVWEPYQRAVDLDFQTFMTPIPDQPSTITVILAGISLLLFLKVSPKNSVQL
jgi:hypothetical protein